MMDEKRKAAAEKLLDAAHEFWKACRAEGQYGAVQWLTSTSGELLIFTRGEYRATLLKNIDCLEGQGVHRLSGEEFIAPGDEPDEEVPL